MAAASLEDVLEFWFGAPPADEAELMGKIRRWFDGGDAVDGEVVTRFGGAVTAAVDGGLVDWESSPRGQLALVLLLDQFTRNVFRGTPRMYAGDPRAQRLAIAAFDDGGSADQLEWVEQLFLALPLLHSEDAAHLRREMEIATAAARRAPPLFKAMSAMLLEQSAKYRDVIARFGRFPHRNAILGRSSTPEEVAFLATWEESAQPAGMRPDPA